MQHASSSGEQRGRQQQVDGEDGEERHALGGPAGVAERATRMVHEWAAIAEHESNNNETGSCNSACGTRRPAAQAEHSSGEGSWIKLESTPATCRWNPQGAGEQARCKSVLTVYHGWERCWMRSENR